jgi:hypothetical protein
MITNTKTELDALTEKVLTGVNRALRKLVETAAANDKSLVIGDKHGNSRSVPAKELLAKLNK